MSYAPSYSIAVERQEVTIRFKKDLIDRGALGRFLDYLELESIRKRSQLSENQAATLAKEIDRAVWKDIKHLFAEA